MLHPTVEAVKAIHREVLQAHGGSAGIRDEGLLDSAVAAPQATMMGKPMFKEPVEVAAAYLFYLCRNHPFIDGNKRTALATCLVFLSENGCLKQEKLDTDDLGTAGPGCCRKPDRPRGDDEEIREGVGFITYNQ
ncbi:MAG: type II toxin-antitoxin system death-on-curing family toxin, partial [Verrucomicrobia bacterium]|nr:type II toxin-antitoxin system death-on-curing family toxin [Verrucomicrobiota bacterium]